MQGLFLPVHRIGRWNAAGHSTERENAHAPVLLLKNFSAQYLLYVEAYRPLHWR